MASTSYIPFLIVLAAWGLAMRPVNAAGAVLARSANAAGGLDIHSVNAASAAHLSQIGNDAGASTASQSSNLQGLRYGQTECKEAAG